MEVLKFSFKLRIGALNGNKIYHGFAYAGAYLSIYLAS